MASGQRAEAERLGAEKEISGAATPPETPREPLLLRDTDVLDKQAIRGL